MKIPVLLPFLTLPLLFSSCGLLMVDHSPKPPVHVGADVEPRDVGPVPRLDERSPARSTAAVVTPPIVTPPRAERPRVATRFHSDRLGRYYLSDGRRVYANAGNPR